MTIEIDEMKSIVIVEWLQQMFDRVNKAADKAVTAGDLRKVARLEGEYNGAREALGSVGIRVRFDRHTKRPVGIEPMEARGGNA